MKGREWEEAVFHKFEALYECFPGWSEETHEEGPIWCPGRYTYPVSEEYSAWVNIFGMLLLFLGAFANLQEATISFMSVCLAARNNSAPTGRVLTELGIWTFFEILSRKFRFR